MRYVGSQFMMKILILFQMVLFVLALTGPSHCVLNSQLQALQSQAAAWRVHTRCLVDDGANYWNAVKPPTKLLSSTS